MTFSNTRGIFSIALDNGITVMSIRDYAFMLRDTIENVRHELAIDTSETRDIADFVFMKSNVDSDDDVLLGVQYHEANSIFADEYNKYYAIIGCKKDSYVEYDEMVEYLLNQ